MIQLNIIAGFLGAGKTTFINRLLEDGLSVEHTVLIQNEFGEVDVDSDLIGGDIDVLELSSGCICCTLQGSFIDGIKKVAEQYSPERILIEPTGAANLGDIINACRKACNEIDASIGSVISIVSAEAIPALLFAGGEFTERQISEAHFILVSGTQFLDEEELDDCRALIAEHAPETPVHWENWDELDMYLILQEAEQVELERGEDILTGLLPVDLPESAANLRRSHRAARHEKGQFESLAFFPTGSFGNGRAMRLLEELESGSCGRIWRAKGFLMDSDGTMLLAETAPGGRKEVRPCDYRGEPKFVIIGENTDRERIRMLMEKEGS